MRSSATAEDMAAASFAGQYRSYLEIGDDEALLRAVRLVWASLWLPAPRTYRAHTGVPEDDLAMSVVVMRLVDAERAGVVFTVNPAGSGNDLRIEAVEGLGEQLVSGEVTPEAYVLPALRCTSSCGGSRSRRGSRRPLSTWSVDSAIHRTSSGHTTVQQLYIVQSRPITTISFRAALRRRIRHPDRSRRCVHDGGYRGVAARSASPSPVDDGRTLDRERLSPTVRPDECTAHRSPTIDRSSLAFGERAVLSLDLMKAAAAEVPGWIRRRDRTAVLRPGHQ